MVVGAGGAAAICIVRRTIASGRCIRGGRRCVAAVAAANAATAAGRLIRWRRRGVTTCIGIVAVAGGPAAGARRYAPLQVFAQQRFQR